MGDVCWSSAAAVGSKWQSRQAWGRSDAVVFVVVAVDADNIVIRTPGERTSIIPRDEFFRIYRAVAP